MELSFNVEPEAFPPTNIHIIIGRKGVGKTYLINNMINSLIDD
jgi:chromosomal replication initiation ATPase DnaA